MISFSKNFLFIHIPKTAGDSITDVLLNHSCKFEIFSARDEGDRKKYAAIYKGPANFYAGEDVKHMRYHEYKWLYSQELLDNLTKFSVVRNPFDRVLSLHLYYNNFKFDRELFKKSIFENAKTIWSMWNPQSWYTTDVEVKGSPPDTTVIAHKDNQVDFILKFEDKFKDFKKLCNHIGIEYTELPRLNTSPDRPHYSSYYDSDLRNIVETIYQDDLKEFEYEFDTQKTSVYFSKGESGK
jgi:hypothetical protein